ncbi:hypothetical protein DID88_002615 [Monilinia fructigena]|uniref:Uncharacterized protein n=1 Tax=Monilinia fructigena TaxID=38457 RepID=A0A395IUU6_9HELO|nr:hypothetical protein DID88_002615 [Monilinia fructigena]
MKQLEALLHVHPEDSSANAVDHEGNDGILLAATTEDAGLDTVERTALMEWRLLDGDILKLSNSSLTMVLNEERRISRANNVG